MQQLLTKLPGAVLDRATARFSGLRTQLPSCTQEQAAVSMRGKDWLR